MVIITRGRIAGSMGRYTVRGALVAIILIRVDQQGPEDGNGLPLDCSADYNMYIGMQCIR